MRFNFLLILLGLVTLSAFASPPMAVEPLPLDAMQARAQKEGWTFEYKAYDRKFYTGRIPKEGIQDTIPSMEYRNSQKALPSKFSLADKVELAPVMDQGPCGSCVYNAFLAALLDTFRFAGVVLPQLARQELMDCYARDWRCNGSFFEKVAEGHFKSPGLHEESVYPYRAANGSCKTVQGTLYGKIKGYKLIDPTPASGAAALTDGKALNITIAANNTFSSYKDGVFNACSASAQVNHEVEGVGYDCEGECNFDERGFLPNGRGYWIVKNSWGKNWGADGYFKIKMTDKNGRRCNSVAEEIGIIDIGIDPKPACEPQPVANAGMEKLIVIGGGK